MTATRREILKSGLVVGASLTGGLTTKLVGAAAAGLDNTTLSAVAQPGSAVAGIPARQVFAELVDEKFRVDMGSEEPALPIKLCRIIDPDVDSFILVFETRDSRKLPQDTHRLDNASTGPLSIFMVQNPVFESEFLEPFVVGGGQKSARRFYYEAVFNQRRAV